MSARTVRAVASRGQRRPTVFGGRHDEVGDGPVEVGVDDGGAGVGSAESGEHAAQLAVVQLGEAVEAREAAGLRVVRAGADGALVLREQLRLAAQRDHARDHHRACSGGDHVLFGCMQGRLSLEDEHRADIRECAACELTVTTERTAATMRRTKALTSPTVRFRPRAAIK